MSQNSKTQNVTKHKTQNLAKLKKSKGDTTLKLKIFTKKSKCDKTKKKI